MNQTTEDTPKWLEELQQRSWEPEVLLSGIVLYGMFKAPPLLEKFAMYFKTNVVHLTDVDGLVGILKLGIYWLIFGLILHLISRGIWVGMIGLSYIFPNGILIDRLRLKGKFHERVDSLPSFQKIIMNLEKVCSSLFSISFMLFMSTLGAYLYLFTMIVIPFAVMLLVFDTWIFSQGWLAQIYVITVFGIGVIGFLDFITLGFIRRFGWVAKIYWPIHSVISVLTLARFYRPIYYAFVSNYNRWVVGAVLVVFTMICFYSLDGLTTVGYSGDSVSQLTLWHNSSGYSAYSGYYDDQNDDVQSVQAHIQSDIIDENVIRLFIPANIGYEDSIKKYANYDSLMKIDSTWRPAERDFYAVQKFYRVYLDDSLVSSEHMYFHYKKRTEQRGYLCYIDIAALPQGTHDISVGGPTSMYKTRRWARIPFYRDVKRDDETIRQKPEEEEYFRAKPFLTR